MMYVFSGLDNSQISFSIIEKESRFIWKNAYKTAIKVCVMRRAKRDDVRPFMIWI